MKKKQFAAVLSASLCLSALPFAAFAQESVTEEATSEASTAVDADSDLNDTRDVVRIGSLKGPTSIGILPLLKESEDQNTSYNYEDTMVTAADELITKIVGGKLDIALIPANVASVLYNKTKGGISVIDINTLGVLYLVTGDDAVTNIEDLAGKTVYLTGKGQTPDYVLQYLLKETGISDSVTLEYKSEASEVAAVLKNDSNAIGLLPQPFATVACMQNTEVSPVVDLNDAWADVAGDSALVTGVTIVRNEFLAQNPDAVTDFLSEHEASVNEVNDDEKAAADLIVEAGIIEKAPVAQKALPFCNITYLDGSEMKDALSGYLTVLSEFDATSIGGTLPEEDFYYIAE